MKDPVKSGRFTGSEKMFIKKFIKNFRSRIPTKNDYRFEKNLKPCPVGQGWGQHWWAMFSVTLATARGSGEEIRIFEFS